MKSGIDILPFVGNSKTIYAKIIDEEGEGTKMTITQKDPKQLMQMISVELQLKLHQVEQVIQLLEDGNTVPFIARYRKEVTGALDEVQIKTIMERWQYIQNLEQRKSEVVRLISEQGKLTEELEASIVQSTKLQMIEDIYRPYKQKRRTKATIAKEKGLEPLAQWMLTLPREGSLETKASDYLSEENQVISVEEALEGAKEILAETFSDDASVRDWIRRETFNHGRMKSVVKNKEKDEKGVFEMYYEYEEAIKKIVPHRVLALNRGEKEEILRVSVQVDAEKILQYMARKWIKQKETIVQDFMIEAMAEAYKRFIQTSIEREIRNELTDKGEDQAIHIFSENLKNLLLQPPLKGRMVLGVDPAYRTGCKLAIVEETGKMTYIGVIYPHAPRGKWDEGKRQIAELLRQHPIEVIAIGNGTASRETEQFIAEVIQDSKSDASYLIVNEAGASVYSASDLAREEFPDLQVEERSAVSIARRLQDPLSELVKIDPKSVGVGQYQHDVSQKKLNDSLSFVVETVVNRVGVNVNTASVSLLQYVAGLSKTVAQNVVKERESSGKFLSRQQLKTIPRLGAKTYEQCIGFLRIVDGKDPLDRTPIHPENYKKVNQLLSLLGHSSKDLGSEALKESLNRASTSELALQVELGELTVRDIVDALKMPSRDPRDDHSKPLLKKDVLKIEDLKEGMELQGTVRNVVDFGAFVDIGVKQDGLVHISKLKNGFVKHPLDVVALGDVVTVWVDQVDQKKGRISLTMVPAT